MEETKQLATFAGGCFWCMVKPFDEQPGIISVISGYTGGHVRTLHMNRFVRRQRVIMKLFKLPLIRKFSHMKNCLNYIGSKSIQPILAVNSTTVVSPIEPRFFTIMKNKKSLLNNPSRTYKKAGVSLN
jgi:hypothetical protein